MAGYAPSTTSAGSGAASAYKTFDRGTAAGNKLYHLYNRKNMDSTLDRDLLKRLEAHRKEKENAEKPPPPKVVPKSKAFVAVPQVGRGFHAGHDNLVPLAPSRVPVGAYGGRKSGAVIREEMAVSKANEAPPPAPAKPAITEEEKNRLRQIMEHGKELPKRAPPTAEQLAARLPPTEREMFVRRFGEVQEEIKERRDFIAELNGPNGRHMPSGKDPAVKQRTERQLEAEIAARIDELKRIDAWLRANPDD